METCVVVGAGPGLGSALATRFARGGFAVALLARAEATLVRTAEEVERIGGTARTYVADASDAVSLTAALARVVADGAAPSVAIYNVAAPRDGAPTSLDPEAYVADFRSDVVGAVVTARTLAPAMRTRGGGTILLTGGGLALHPAAESATLSVGKAGLRALAFTLAEELEPQGVHVATVTIYGAIAPGTRYDPASIAERYWALHAQPQGTWTREESIR